LSDLFLRGACIILPYPSLFRESRFTRENLKKRVLRQHSIKKLIKTEGNDLSIRKE